MCYDKELFEENPYLEHLICPIGKQILEDPVKIICRNFECASHSYCRTCIIQWLLNDNEKRCPICKSGVYFDLDKLSKDCISYNLVKEFKMKCTNYESNCTWNGKLKDLDDHIKVCPYEEINCTNKGCNIRLKREDTIKHNTECQFYQINCDLCTNMIERKNLQDHKDNKCLMVFVDCKYCGINMLRKNLDDHLNNDCQEIQLECNNAGCKIEFKRKEQLEHNKICEYISLSCILCNEIMLRRETETHNKICPESQTNCDHCNINLKYKEKEKHEKTCLERLIECEYKKMSNCTKKYKLKDKDIHMSEYKFNHLENGLIKMSNKLNKLKTNSTMKLTNNKNIILQKSNITLFKAFGYNCKIRLNYYDVNCYRFRMSIETIDNIKVYMKIIINNYEYTIDTLYNVDVNTVYIDILNKYIPEDYINNNNMNVTIESFKIKRLYDEDLDNVKFNRI